MLSTWTVMVSKRCALILTNPKLRLIKTQKLFDGCVIKAKISYDEQLNFTAICVYAPASAEDNLIFWKKVRSLKSHGLVILFGDVNTVIDPRYDIFGGIKNPRPGAKAYKGALNNLNLKDALLSKVNLLENMTFVIKCKKLKSKAGSRLDVFAVSKDYSQYFSQPEVHSCLLSDHKPVSFYFDLAPPHLPKEALIH
ncbi:hypothetical protein DSO57_1001296 [Entomophthora muscae]|uniref:Uncharacterized protein n=1 Tax=Entomophthora muscae TaxID=34485 RepID=A0ACC2T8U6_9FUNG|nr:hypothetical protein DSO57_1001296 [Entomophthora muscae]